MDERLIFIRPDGSVWSESSSATRVDELDAEELALSVDHVESLDLADPETQAEISHWRRVPSFLAWLHEGGPHPSTASTRLAVAFARGAVRTERAFQRIDISGLRWLVSETRFALMRANPALLEGAREDPRSLRLACQTDLLLAWREALFETSIAFSEDALPPIPPRTPILARARRDGSWLFEHPSEPSWICLMGAWNTSVEELFLHNGLEPYDFGPGPGLGF